MATKKQAPHHKENIVADGHKLARGVRKVDSTVYMGEVIASGNPKRIERYFLRKLAYKLFGKFMGKTLNKI
ncbi:MAG: hypothetical protein H0X24_07315 [Ktedonobacterales bacterium]|nr:hypothetical protein [Ktedonobacterales bacterium]